MQYTQSNTSTQPVNISSLRRSADVLPTVRRRSAAVPPPSRRLATLVLISFTDIVQIVLLLLHKNACCSDNATIENNVEKMENVWRLGKSLKLFFHHTYKSEAPVIFIAR